MLEISEEAFPQLKLPKLFYTNVRREKVARKSEKKDTISSTRKTKPALSPEARENQLIALAVDLAEKQLMEGTASAQVITHYLKLGTMKEQLEREKLERENELLRVKSEAIQSAQRVEELYANAIEAMRSYRSLSDDEGD